jgi:hypothetical protein
MSCNANEKHWSDRVIVNDLAKNFITAILIPWMNMVQSGDGLEDNTIMQHTCMH